jgi:hypothetical protein
VILSPEQLEQVKEGKKTMVRLPVIGSRDCRLREGHVYTPRTADAPGNSQITVLSVKQQRLRDASPGDAVREGHRHTRALFDWWRETHGVLDLDQEVHVVFFALGDRRDVDRYLAAGSPAQTCGAMIDDPHRPGKKRRCGAGFSDDPVPQASCGHCGARRRDEGMDDHGYTTSRRRAVAGEMPAVPPEIQEQQTKEAHERQSHSQWSPIHGPASRLARELPEMKASLAQMRTVLAAKPNSRLKREIQRAEKGVTVVEKALEGIRGDLLDAA